MNKKRVIVVGAGMAGVAATRTLHDAQIEVVCLDARTRIGGRAHTDWSLETAIDLGGSWIHGPIGNPMTPLADRFGVAYSPSFKQDIVYQLVFRRDATMLSASEMEEFGRGRERAAVVHEQVVASLLHQAAEGGQSLAALCEMVSPQPDTMTPAEALGFYYGSRLLPSIYDAGDPTQIDWRLAESYVDLLGNDVLLHGGGYGRIVDGLAAGLDIRLGTEVTAVSWDDAGVRVQTVGGEELTADFAIITVPLGVLKVGAIAFDPPLPQSKQDAIRRIGFGSFEKLALRFDKCYWPTDKQRFTYFEHEVSTQDTEIFHTWVNMAAYNSEPVLVVLNSGQSRVARWNSLSDEALVEQAMGLLRQMFGEVPEPIAWVRTGWQADPFAQGAYSFDQVGQQPEDRQQLADPVGQRLFFAGEATHTHFYATVHGAYGTGVWTAQQIVAMLDAE